MSTNTLHNVLDELENSHGDDRDVRRLVSEARAAARAAPAGDPYFERVKRFHEEVRKQSTADYLSVRSNDVLNAGTPLDDYHEIPDEARLQYARVVAERNRLFWATFLNEEAGEVADILSSGGLPEEFEREVVDVLVVCHAIADCFGFNPLEVFGEVMEENEKKPKRQEGTGKLPAEARDRWERAEEDGGD